MARPSGIPANGWVARLCADAEVAADADAESRLATIGALAYANNEVVDVNLIDVALKDGKLVAHAPARAHPRRRPDQSTTRRKLRPEDRTRCIVTMNSTRAFVNARVAEFKDQVERRLKGEITEDQFRPLRLMNGVYLQLHAYMLRVAIPYGTLSSKQMRKLAHIARTYDRGYGHFTTRQNIQYNWPALKDMPEVLAELAEVEMHAMQTSGNCIRNVTADHFAGVAADEVADPRPASEILRQWSSIHPEFSYLPRKFKIAVTGAPKRPRRHSGA